MSCQDINFVPCPMKFSFPAQGRYRENKSIRENWRVKMFKVAAYHAVVCDAFINIAFPPLLLSTSSFFPFTVIRIVFAKPKDLGHRQTTKFLFLDHGQAVIIFPDSCLCQRPTMWLGSSAGRVLARQARGPDSSPGRDTIFFLPCGIWWASVGSRLGQRTSKSACLVVPPLFRADSGTNLIKQGVKRQRTTMWLGSSVGRVLAGKREALGSSPVQATIFSSPVTLVSFCEPPHWLC